MRMHLVLIKIILEQYLLVFYFRFNFFHSSHITIPVLTETFNECFVPNCGISITSSHSDKTSSETPLTSLPITIAIVFFKILKLFKYVEFLVCSTPII